MGAFDSENRYAFVGLQPHMAIDPLGLARRTRHGGVNHFADAINSFERFAHSFRAFSAIHTLNRQAHCLKLTQINPAFPPRALSMGLRRARFQAP
jgi:hypothetical protein